MLTDTDKQFILKRIDFISDELNDLKEYEDITFDLYSSDRKSQRNIERIAENVANAIIDIAKLTISAYQAPLPDSYRDLILNLGTIKIIEPALSNQIADITRLRNILAHQYLDIKWDYLKSFISEDIKFVQQFTCEIKKIIE